MDKPFLHESDDHDLPAAPDRRRAVVLGGLAVAALGVGGMLLLGGSGDEVVDEVAASAPVAQVTASPSPSTSASPPARATAASGRSARNPFQVLLGTPVGAPAAGSSSTTTAAAAPATPPDALPEPGSPAGGPGLGGTPRSGGVPAPRAAVPSVELVLVGVQGTDAARSAVFTVGGARQTVEVADSFGPDGSLLLLSLQEGPEAGQWTAVVQRGQADPFDLVTGQPVALA